MDIQDVDSINDLIPNRKIDANFDSDTLSDSVIAREEKRLQARANSFEIARIRSREQAAQKNVKLYEGLDNAADYNKIVLEEKMTSIKKAVSEASANQSVVIVQDAALAGTTRPEIQKLLASLNINLNMQMTKNDTYNLLATLLTCNEAQLSALSANKKIPLAIKIVIKRLQNDANDGNIVNIEKLWDRIFGTQVAKFDMPQGYTGIIPNQPVSREAYVLIRETLIGRE